MLYQQQGSKSSVITVPEDIIVDDNPPSPVPKPEPVQIGVVPLRANREKTGMVSTYCTWLSSIILHSYGWKEEDHWHIPF